MSQIFYAGLSREDAEETYAAWLLGNRPPHAVTVSGGNLYLSPPLPRPTSAAETEISGVNIATTEEETVTATAARNFFAWRRLPGRLICARDETGLLVCDKPTWETLTVDLSWAPLSFPNLLTDVLTEKEAADALGIPEKELKTKRETGSLSPRLWKPSGQTALYLASAVGKMKNGAECFSATGNQMQNMVSDTISLSQNLSDEKIRQNQNISEAKNGMVSAEKNESATGAPVSEIKIPDRELLPLLLVFTPPEAAPLWNRPAEEIRSAAAGAGHRAARLAESESRQAGRHRLIGRAALETLFGTPDPKAWQDFLSRFL